MRRTSLRDGLVCDLVPWVETARLHSGSRSARKRAPGRLLSTASLRLPMTGISLQMIRSAGLSGPRAQPVGNGADSMDRFGALRSEPDGQARPGIRLRRKNPPRWFRLSGRRGNVHLGKQGACGNCVYQGLRRQGGDVACLTRLRPSSTTSEKHSCYNRTGIAIGQPV